MSTDGGKDPVWAHNGTELFYLDTGAASWYLTVATVRTDPDFAVESRAQLFSFAPYYWAGNDVWWDVSPDDQRILVLGPSEEGVGRYVLVQNFFEELRQRVGNCPLQATH